MNSNSESVQLINVNAAGTIWNIELASLAALVVQLWELANSFFDEAEYLCRSRFTAVKALYIWSRYVPLIMQIVNLTLTHKMNELPMRTRLCVWTFVYKAAVGQQALTCVEIILLIRVYALYNQSRRVKYFLCAAFLTNFTFEMWGSSQIIGTLGKGKSCIAEILPFAPLIAFGASASFLQVSILCMTLFKYVAGHHYGRARSPLTSLILREGVVVAFVIFGIVVVNVVYEHIRTVELEVSNAAYAWYLSLLSVAGCRLILDMRKLELPSAARSTGEIELTSNLDMT